MKEYHELKQAEENLALHIATLLKNANDNQRCAGWLANVIGQALMPNNIMSFKTDEPDILFTIGELVRDINALVNQVAAKAAKVTA